jgi:hypothetical protein
MITWSMWRRCGVDLAVGGGCGGSVVSVQRVERPELAFIVSYAITTVFAGVCRLLLDRCMDMLKAREAQREAEKKRSGTAKRSMR